MTGGAGARTTTLDGNRASLEAALTPSGRWVGAALPFRSRLASPPPEGKAVLVRFVNRRDALAGLD